MLKYGAWKIEVVSVWRGVVSYRKSRWKEVASGTQTIQEWCGWAKDAKVKSRGMDADECVVTASAAGSCSKCGRWTDRPHLSDAGLRCEKCCTASKHVDPRKKKETVDV